MHNSTISENLQRVMRKLSSKDKTLYEQLIKKIEEIKKCYDIEHYKNLRYDFKDLKRVHLGHFVLVFQYDKSTDTINFDDFDHHDKIYNKS